MKRFCFLLAFLAFFLSQSVYAQVNEGTITYSLDFPELEIPAAQKSLLPSEAIAYFKGGNYRNEITGGMGMKSITISNEKESVMLLDIMGNKKAIKNVIKKDSKSNRVKITDEKKRIAGYDCQKAILSTGDGEIVDVWFTKDISGGGSWGGSFGEINGAPLEYIIDNKGMKIKMTAVKVSAEKVNLNVFDIPEGYKEVS